MVVKNVKYTRTESFDKRVQLIENRMALKSNCDNNIHFSKELEKRVVELEHTDDARRININANFTSISSLTLKIGELEKKLSDLQKFQEIAVKNLNDRIHLIIEKIGNPNFTCKMCKDQEEYEESVDAENEANSLETIREKDADQKLNLSNMSDKSLNTLNQHDAQDVVVWKGKKYKIVDKHQDITRIDEPLLVLKLKEVVDEKSDGAKAVEIVKDNAGYTIEHAFPLTVENLKKVANCKHGTGEPCKIEKQEVVESEKLEFQGSIYEFRVRGNGWRIFAQPLQKYIKPDDIIMEYDFDNLMALEEAVLKAKSLRERGEKK